jgi:hypothetical protein
MQKINVFKQIYKVAGAIIGLLLVIALPAFFAYDEYFNEPKAAIEQQKLEQEFKAIIPMANACFGDYKASHKTRHSLVNISFSSISPFQETKEYYDKELVRNGWRFHKEEKWRDWGRDFGAKSVAYCKGNYEAELWYNGESSGPRSYYAFSVSWGLESLNEKWNGDTCRDMLTTP